MANVSQRTSPELRAQSQTMAEKCKEDIDWVPDLLLLGAQLNCKVAKVSEVDHELAKERPGVPVLVLVTPIRPMALSKPPFFPVVGTFDDDHFISIICERLEKAAKSSARILGVRSRSLNPVIRLKMFGTQFRLCYSRHSGPLQFRTLPQELQSFMDWENVYQNLENRDVFACSHRHLKLWAMEQGLLSPKIGFLDDLQIALLLLPVYGSRIARESSQHSVQAPVIEFFAYYKSFDFESKMIHNAEVFNDASEYARSTEEALVVLTPLSPVRNTTKNSRLCNVQTLSLEINRTYTSISRALEDRADSMGNDMLTNKQWIGGGAAAFLDEFDHYVQIDVRFWGLSMDVWARSLALVESSVPSLLQQISALAKETIGRPWPTFFAHRDFTYQKIRSDGLHYLLGLKTTGKAGHFDAKKLTQLLTHQTEELQHKISGPEFSKLYIGFELVNRSDLSDFKEFKNCKAVEELHDLKESFGDDPGLEALLKQYVTINSPLLRSSMPDTQQVLGRDSPVQKQRPASDVLKRLRWDPQYSAEAHIIGYTDRFNGIQEIEASRWAVDTTEDIFIPQHRIVYFKRTSDGEVVWDRKRQIDKIFSKEA